MEAIQCLYSWIPSTHPYMCRPPAMYPGLHMPIGWVEGREISKHPFIDPPFLLMILKVIGVGISMPGVAGHTLINLGG